MQCSKDTLQLIQREISEVVQRERELKEMYSKLDAIKPKVIMNGVPKTTNSISTNGVSKTTNSISTNGVSKNTNFLSNGFENLPKQGRLYAQNHSTKGAMHRFIKARGRTSTISPTNVPASKSTAWINTDVIELQKPIISLGVQPRNGFIPTGERIRKELVEMEARETELVLQRTKSQPDLLILFDSNSPEPSRSLQSACSVSQLSDSTYDSSLCSFPTSLKGARSLADLCDVDIEEDVPLGSVNLIKRWEGIIQQNQHS